MGAKFKVGDRVKLKKGHGMAQWNRRDGDTGVVTENSCAPFIRWDRDGEVWAAAEQELQLATPALTVEAGKFYKTRDGRKVGPIRRAQKRNDPWPWKSHEWLVTYYYKNDGFSCPGSAHLHQDRDDLVAEWEEPAVAVAASNDNGTVKRNVPNVGDFVTQRSWHSGFYEVTRIDGENLWIKMDGINDLRDDLKSEWIVRRDTQKATPAIVALIENGQPKPATKPKVHTDQASATKEAERLALAHPGQRFGVFILADSKIAERYEEKVWATRLVA